ncbi:hypothetical protein CDL12_12792 [Handroanthus impetiginosus]|uniref:Vicilin N-terminal domain-containing protein n=1 Tax=Handroanthus impetiginosus TaxID=429701 RepID=A0A2G9HAM5_9LAMI|nr:hypothetical protein CDL12_12792 [Handroanthus impetiginosus]
MSFKARFCLVLFALVLASHVASGAQDPELQQCTHQCIVEQQFDHEQREICFQRCEWYVRQKNRREQGGGSGGAVAEGDRESPIERLRECVRGCEQQRGERRQECQKTCQKEYERERERHQGGGRGDDIDNPTDPQKGYQHCWRQCRRQSEGGKIQEQCERLCVEQGREREEGQRGEKDEMYEERERGEEEREGENPYVFEDRHFKTGLQSQYGRVRILQKFTDRSELLRGIENYRVAILEADPQTFIVPNHWDADDVIFVANG